MELLGVTDFRVLAPIVCRSEFGSISNFVLKLTDTREDVVCSFLSFAPDPR